MNNDVQCKKYYYVYILRCADDSYYVGMTDDLHRRRWEHNEGIFENSYTSSRQPTILLYAEEFESIEFALKREKQLKGWSRKKKEALINDEHSRLHELSKCINKTHFKHRA